MTGLSERLRQLRYKSGFSQRQVAERIHVAQSAISCYEAGSKTPTLENLVELARLYRCSTDYLLGFDNRTNKPMSIKLDSLTEKQTAIIYSLLESWDCDPGIIEKGQED